MVGINSNAKRARMRKLVALAVAASFAVGAAIMPAHAAPLAAHSAGHHTAIIIVGGRGCC